MLGSKKFTLFEKISNMSQKILLDIHHHMHQHMIEDTQKDTEDTEDTQEILTIKIIKVDYGLYYKNYKIKP